MYDLPRVSFMVVLDALLVAMLVVLLGGCVSTPTQNRYRHGDFIMNIGSTGTIVEPMADAAPRTGTTSRIGIASSNVPIRG